MGIDLSKIIKEDMDGIINNFVKQVEAWERRRAEIINDRGIELYERLFDVAFSGKSLSSEYYLYSPDETDVISEEDYHAMFSAMQNFSVNELYDDENPFSHAYYIYSYKGKVVQLFTMSGQGTVTKISSVDEDILGKIPTNDINSFEELLLSFKKIE